MKKPANVEDLTARLTAAGSAPLMSVVPPVVAATPEPLPPPEPVAPPPKPGRVKQSASKPLLMRVPGALFDRYEAEAIRRTKATGKGVSVQQVMLEKLEASL